MTPYPSDATKGSASKALAERAVHTVRVRTRRQSPPLADYQGLCTTLRGFRCRDPDTSPGEALEIAARRGAIVICEVDGRAYRQVGLPCPAVFRAALDDVTPESVGAAIEREASRDAPRRQYIGALNELADSLNT